MENSRDGDRIRFGDFVFAERNWLKSQTEHLYLDESYAMSLTNNPVEPSTSSDSFVPIPSISKRKTFFFTTFQRYVETNFTTPLEFKTLQTCTNRDFTKCSKLIIYKLKALRDAVEVRAYTDLFIKIIESSAQKKKFLETFSMTVKKDLSKIFNSTIVWDEIVGLRILICQLYNLNLIGNDLILFWMGNFMSFALKFVEPGIETTVLTFAECAHTMKTNKVETEFLFHDLKLLMSVDQVPDDLKFKIWKTFEDIKVKPRLDHRQLEQHFKVALEKELKGSSSGFNFDQFNNLTNYDFLCCAEEIFICATNHPAFHQILIDFMKSLNKTTHYTNFENNILKVCKFRFESSIINNDIRYDFLNFIAALHKADILPSIILREFLEKLRTSEATEDQIKLLAFSIKEEQLSMVSNRGQILSNATTSLTEILKGKNEEAIGGLVSTSRYVPPHLRNDTKFKYPSTKPDINQDPGSDRYVSEFRELIFKLSLSNKQTTLNQLKYLQYQMTRKNIEEFSAILGDKALTAPQLCSTIIEICILLGKNGRTKSDRKKFTSCTRIYINAKFEKTFDEKNRNIFESQEASTKILKCCVELVKTGKGKLKTLPSKIIKLIDLAKAQKNNEALILLIDFVEMLKLEIPEKFSNKKCKEALNEVAVFFTIELNNDGYSENVYIKIERALKTLNILIYSKGQNMTKQEEERRHEEYSLPHENSNLEETEVENPIEPSLENTPRAKNELKETQMFESSELPLKKKKKKAKKIDLKIYKQSVVLDNWEDFIEPPILERIYIQNIKNFEEFVQELTSNNLEYVLSKIKDFKFQSDLDFLDSYAEILLFRAVSEPKLATEIAKLCFRLPLILPKDSKYFKLSLIKAIDLVIDSNMSNTITNKLANNLINFICQLRCHSNFDSCEFKKYLTELLKYSESESRFKAMILLITFLKNLPDDFKCLEKQQKKDLKHFAEIFMRQKENWSMSEAMKREIEITLKCLEHGFEVEQDVVLLTAEEWMDLVEKSTEDERFFIERLDEFILAIEDLHLHDVESVTKSIEELKPMIIHLGVQSFARSYLSIAVRSEDSSVYAVLAQMLDFENFRELLSRMVIDEVLSISDFDSQDQICRIKKLFYFAGELYNIEWLSEDQLEICLHKLSLNNFSTPTQIELLKVFIVTVSMKLIKSAKREKHEKEILSIKEKMKTKMQTAKNIQIILMIKNVLGIFEEILKK